MFIPICCPNIDCRAHRDPVRGFFVREGFYHPLCRSHAVPRFRCRVCRRGFSRQTFRADRRQKKPAINAACLDLMVSCVGMRQAARVARRTVERRFAWLARHAADFQANRLAAARRDGGNPLFPINHTNARLRHFLARLRRRTWCVTKKRTWLQAHLHIAALWSNFCRGITNRTRTTPAQGLRLAPRRYRSEEVLGWRQDWGPLSPPLPA